MQLNVLRELRQPIGSVTVAEFDEPTLRLDGTVFASLRGSARLLRTDRGLLVSLQATAMAHEQCSRCLSEMECPLELTFEEEYVPVVDAQTGASVYLEEAEDAFRIAPDFTLDLREGLRQYMLLSEPLKPLCRPDCAGLCPHCGADLNSAACGCDTTIDSRWEALTALRSGNQEGR